jgi:hypothetical protein
MSAKPADSLFWKLDGYLFNALGFLTLFAGIACIGWAALVLLTQVFGWIRVGEWQPVPLFSLLISEAAQADLRVHLLTPQPLNLVPVWGAAAHAEEIAANAAGSLMGIRKILVWVLECPLVAGLLAACAALFMAGGGSFNRANEGRS